MRMYRYGKVNLRLRVLAGLAGVLTLFASIVFLTHVVTTHADSYVATTPAPGGVLTATASISGTGSNFSDTSKLCTNSGWSNGNQHADFTASLSNPSVTLGATQSTLSYDITLNWKGCDADNDGHNDKVDAYSIYSTNFCPVSGNYTHDAPYTSHDCLKYVGANPATSPETADYANNLGCTPGGGNGHGSPCTASNFTSDIQVVDDRPSLSLHTRTEHKTFTINNPAQDTRSSGSKIYGYDPSQPINDNDYICEYYRYPSGTANVFSKQSNPNRSRCILLSININWTYTPNPTSTCNATLSTSSLAPGQQARINYTITTQNVPGTPSGSIMYATITPAGGSIVQGGLTASGSTLTGSATFTAPSTTGTYSINSGTFASSPGTYNSTCPSFGAITVSYMPYFRAVGGDIAAGTGFGSSCAMTSGQNIKSWNANGSQGLNPSVSNDYNGAGTTTAAFATGAITNFVSGLGLSGAPNGGTGTFGTGSVLSFTNTTNTSPTNPTNLHGGSFDNLPCIPDYYGTLPATLSSPPPGTVSGPGPTVTLTSDWDTGSYSFPYSITLQEDQAHPIAAGKAITLYVKGNVYITNDINYAPYTFSTVPRFNLYVSGNIYIKTDVTDLHGVYIAQKPTLGTGGNIVTCTNATGTASEPYADCSSPLTIYGAAAAQGSFQLTRTYGSLNGTGFGAASFNPAEVVRYTPELWLGGASGNSLGVQSYTSLPPIL